MTSELFVDKITTSDGDEFVKAHRDVTGGGIFSGVTSTLKLPVGETDLTNGVGGGASTEELDAAVTQAEAARDAAIIGADVYADEPTGRAAVADGVAFKVQGSGDIAAYEYRRTNSGTSALIATYPSDSAVKARAFNSDGAPAYANAGGQGDRTSEVVVSVTAGLIGSGIAANLVDGATAANTTDSVAFAAVAIASKSIQFDFGVGARRLIVEATWKQSNTNSHGVWQWQASNDAATWASIGSTFTVGGATSQAQTELSSNKTGYRFYRLLGVSGVASASPYVQEIEFKIAKTPVDGYAPVVSRFPSGFPVSKLVAGYFFNEASGSVVADAVGTYPIDLALPTTPNVTLTGKSAKLASGLIQTPVLMGVRAQTILYRGTKDATTGYLISGGSSSGQGTTQQNLTNTETHKMGGFGLDIFTPPSDASGSACYALNRGGWALYHREQTAAYDSSYGLGGRHSTTTTRCTDFEINCAFFWNSTLTTDELAAVYLYVRQQAAKVGIWLHRGDTPERNDLYILLGESNCDGRSTLANLSAADRAASMRHTLIAAGNGGSAPTALDVFELGFNQKLDGGFPVATMFGPEFGIAAQRRSVRLSVSANLLEKGFALISKVGLGGTKIAPSSTGIAAGTTWNVAEGKSAGLFWLAYKQILFTLQEAIAAGHGWNDSVRIGLALGLNDATSTTYAPDAATYQGYLQAMWDQLVGLLPGCTLSVTAFRPHASDPSSNATALAAVRAAYDAFDLANASVTVVDTDAYALESDSVHYSAASSRAMGVILHG